MHTMLDKPSPRILALRRSGLLQASMADHFDHLIAHVQDVLDVPVAIVSLVDESRQVFAGHSGLPEPWASLGETPISHSFCQLVVDSGDVLIVTDANTDPRVSDNPAIGDIGVVAYLGVPVSLPSGELIGALAAIDDKPRTWTESDMRRLRTVCTMVEKEIAVRLSEGRWRTLFETMQEGFCVVRAVRGENGTLTDVVFEEANDAVARLTDIPLSKFVGGTLSDLVPDALEEMLPVFDRVLTSGTPEVYANNVARMGRWFENRLRKLDDDRLASTVTDVSARYQAELSLEKTEAYWRDLFHQLHEGFVLGRIIRDNSGNVVDWRYEEVNRAWGELLGQPSDDVVGRTIREVFPGIEDEWILEFANVVRTGEPVTFVKQVTSVGRWFEGRAQAIDDETFVVLFLDVTERIQAEAALRISEAQLAFLVAGMPAGVLLATAPSGQIVMSNRRMDEILGVSPVNRGDAQDYSEFVAYLENDVPFDPRNYPLAKIMSGEARNHTVEVNFERPNGSRLWIEIKGEGVYDQNQTLIAASVIITDIEDRRRASEEQRVLTTELAHRMKNSLAMVQAIVNQSLRTAGDVETGRKAIMQRLAALSKAQDTLSPTNWESAFIKDVIISAMAPHRTGEKRISIDGPRVKLTPQQAVGLSLAIHELATNATKYGALQSNSGRIAIGWTAEGHNFVFTWIETGGPRVIPPERRGFGSKLIENIVAAYFNGEGQILFDAEGIQFKLVGVLDD